MHEKNTDGFTLIEIMITAIVLAAISSLAYVQYNKIMERTYCAHAQRNLMRIYFAADAYKIKNGNYGPLMNNITAINTGLGISIADTRFSYSYSGGTLNYTSYASRLNGPSYNVNLNSANPISPTNPNPNLTHCEPIIR